MAKPHRSAAQNRSPGAGSWRAPNDRRYRIEAYGSHRAAAGGGRRPHRLASGWIVAAGAEVQVDPAALPLEFVVILSLAQ